QAWSLTSASPGGQIGVALRVADRNACLLCLPFAAFARRGTMGTGPVCQMGRRVGERMRLTSRLAILAGIAALAAPFGLAAAVTRASATGAPSEWPQYGQSPRHLNTNPAEKTFTAGDVGGLHTLFTADFGSNTLSEGGPAVTSGMMYIGGFDGKLNAY